MPKRGENIRKRKDGYWEKRYIDFYKPDGKPHYKSVYGVSYAEVKNAAKTEKQQNNDISKNDSQNKDMECVSKE